MLEKPALKPAELFVKADAWYVSLIGPFAGT
jgi:hypothetical protein